MSRFHGAVILSCLMLCPLRAAAQLTTYTLEFDPSARSAGMAMASTAAFWGSNPNFWSNPALTPYRRGIQYEMMHVNLVPGLASDVAYDAKTWTFGLFGLAAMVAGQPSRRTGGAVLDLGESQGSDAQGNPTGTYNPGVTVDAWGFSVNVLETLGQLAGLFGAEPPKWASFADVSLGTSGRDVEVNPLPGYQGETSVRDFGLLVRVTPVNTMEAGDVSGFNGRVDLAYGYSTLGEDDMLNVLGYGSYRIYQHRRNGFAARFAVGQSADLRRSVASSWWRSLVKPDQPVVSVGLALDRDDWTPAGSAGVHADAYGIEVEAFGLLAIRGGLHRNAWANVDGGTFGVGLGVPLFDVATIRYDFSNFPQPKGSQLSGLQRHSVNVMFDVIHAWHTMRPSGP